MRTDRCRLAPAAVICAALALVVQACGGSGATPDAAETAPGDAGQAEPDSRDSGSPGCGACAARTPTGCVPVGVPSCSPGWARDSECGCRPELAPCGNDQLVSPGAPCVDVGAPDFVATTAPATAPSRFPAPPGGTTHSWYVDASATPDGDGSQVAPWTSIAAALDHAGPGEAILIAAGQYPAPLVVRKPVALVGAGPDQVHLTGTLPEGIALWPRETEAYPVSLELVDQADDAQGPGWHVEGLSIRSDGVAMLLGNARGVVVRSIRIERAVGAGVVLDAATATLEDVEVRGVEADAAGHDMAVYLHHQANVVWRGGHLEARDDATDGTGVMVDGSAAIELYGVHIERFPRAGIAALNDTDVALSACLVESVVGPVELRQASIFAVGSRVGIEDTTLRGGSVGIASAQAAVSLSRSTLEGMRPEAAPGPDGKTPFGAAIAAVGGVLIIADSRIHDAPNGVVIGDAYLTVRRSLFTALGLGVFAENTRGEIAGSRLSGRDAAVLVRGLSELALSSCVLEHGLGDDAPPTPNEAAGLIVLAGANVTVRDTTIRGDFRFPLGAQDADVTLTGSEIAGGAGSLGAYTFGGSFSATSTVIHGHEHSGFRAYDGAVVDLTESVLSMTSIGSDFPVATAAFCQSGTLSLANTRVAQSVHSGVHATSGCAVQLRDSRFHHVALAGTEDGERQGDALRVTDGATAEVTRCHFDEAGRAAIVADGGGSHGSPASVVVTECVITANTLSIATENGALLSPSANLIEGNERDDILIDGGIYIDTTPLPPVGAAAVEANP